MVASYRLSSHAANVHERIVNVYRFSSDWRLEVFNVREKLNAACSRDFDYDSGYTEPIKYLDVLIRNSRMRWFGHVGHSTGLIAD